jgi:hypothetical protein
VLSPHVTFIVRSTSDKHTGLVAAVGHTEDFAPHEISTESHANLISVKVKDMMKHLKVKPEDV